MDPHDKEEWRQMPARNRDEQLAHREFANDPTLPGNVRGAITDRIISIQSGNPFVTKFHDEIFELLCQDRFECLSNAEIIGALEFVKWNLINRSY